MLSRCVTGRFITIVMTCAFALFHGVPAKSSESGARPLDPRTTVFIGSSTIELWKTLAQDFPNVPTLNLGAGGTDYDYLVSNVADWARRYPAEKYVIYSGDNDIAAGKSPGQVGQDFRAAVEILHEILPRSRFYVFSIKPCRDPDRRAKIEQVKQANALIRAQANQLGYVTFVDIFPRMLDDQGEPNSELFRDDGVHMNEAGYAIWVRMLSPYLD